MAANVLNSPQAVQMSVFVVRAFLKMRAALTDTRQLAQKLANLEAELKSRLDVHEVAIVEILQRVMNLLDPPPGPEPPKREMGFHVKESDEVGTNGRVRNGEHWHDRTTRPSPIFRFRGEDRRPRGCESEEQIQMGRWR